MKHYNEKHSTDSTPFKNERKKTNNNGKNSHLIKNNINEFLVCESHTEDRKKPTRIAKKSATVVTEKSTFNGYVSNANKREHNTEPPQNVDDGFQIVQ